MAWKTPKIVEVPVGMEINMYMCAARKQAATLASRFTRWTCRRDTILISGS